MASGAHLSPFMLPRELPRELPLDWWDPDREDSRLPDAVLPSDEPLSPCTLPLGTPLCRTQDADAKVYRTFTILTIVWQRQILL